MLPVFSSDCLQEGFILSSLQHVFLFFFYCTYDTQALLSVGVDSIFSSAEQSDVSRLILPKSAVKWRAGVGLVGKMYRACCGFSNLVYASRSCSLSDKVSMEVNRVWRLLCFSYLSANGVGVVFCWCILWVFKVVRLSKCRISRVGWITLGYVNEGLHNTLQKYCYCIVIVVNFR